MKTYQKLTLITVILGLIIPLFGLFLYFFVNSLIGIPILGLVFGSALLVAVLIIAVNIAGLIAAFKVKNPKIAGMLLIGCGVVTVSCCSYSCNSWTRSLCNSRYHGFKGKKFYFEKDLGV